MAETGFAFAFEEGALVKAVRNGDWVLLDEINLASAETLERLVSLLDSKDASLALTERGDLELISRHPDFRLFAAMNPSTDFGKKDLPPSLTSRFTEVYVDEVTDRSDVTLVVIQYFGDVQNAPVDDIVSFYLRAREMATQVLEDGAGVSPRYSLRTLSRALTAARMFLTSRRLSLRRSLYEGFVMMFQTMLENKSAAAMHRFIRMTFVPDVPVKELGMPARRPGEKKTVDEYVLCGSTYWVKKGPLDSVDGSKTSPPKFILTNTVLKHLAHLARALVVYRYPVLLQGPTSSGKTSMVGYLAALAGHKCVRINNHEHTDIQEYLGGYVSDDSGKLTFKEGVLVEAVRNGYWVILDELNLAPSEGTRSPQSTP